MHTAQMQQTIAQYLPWQQETFEQFLASLQAKPTEPVVAVYGVFNAGKSSLLNALTGHVEQEFFATRNIPETKATQSLVHNGLCYLDTPGLDVNMADTLQAKAGVRQADMLLLVHKLGAGSIQADDLQAMRQLVQNHGQPERISVVLTEGETASRNQQLIADLTEQFRQFLPRCTPFVVSNTSFSKGVLQGKQGLIHHSGIPALLEHLQAQSRQLQQSLEQERKEKKQRLQAQLLEAIAVKKSAVQDSLEISEMFEGLHQTQFQSKVLRMRLSVTCANLED